MVDHAAARAAREQPRAAATRRPWRAARSRPPARRTTGSRTRTDSRRSARASARAASSCMREQRLAEADAARDSCRRGRSSARPTAPAAAAAARRSAEPRRRLRALTPSTDSPRSWPSHISSSGATLRIAYARPTTPSRRSAVPYGSAAITSARNRQPVRRRVHLLLGQIQLARSDVLVRVELDLLEADDARDDVDLAVRARPRRSTPARVTASRCRRSLGSGRSAIADSPATLRPRASTSPVVLRTCRESSPSCT